MASSSAVLALCLLAAAAGGAAAQKVGAAAAAGNAAGAAGAVSGAEAGPLPSPSLAGQCKAQASVSPWDIGGDFPNVVICCGGSIDFQWSGNSGVWQIISAACPATFRNSSTARQLLPTTQGSGGVKSLYLPTPGTFWLTSPVDSACARSAPLDTPSNDLKFKVSVPPGSGSVCPVTPTAAPAKATPAPTKAAPTPSPTPSVSFSAGKGSQAAAEGAPGGQSTSTAPDAAAAASGPPNTSFTATRPGMAFSQSGGRRRMQRALL